MSILLTGGTGYIGSHTAAVLVQAGHEVVLLDNLSNSRRGVVDRLRQITGRTLPFVHADVRDRARVAQVLRDHSCTAVIHFAGLKAVGESMQQPLEYFDNNVGGALALLHAMRDVGVATIVFSSSATVYGEPQYLPLDEVHPTSAANPYGRTKLHIEEILADLCRADPAWRVACLRYFNPAGAHDSGLIGEDPNGIPNNLMPYIAKVASGVLPSLGV
ncbi:MAG TPA: UDP-glucose 4-epimerase GalE, partial [Ramlibacter sp.]|nr:UDP-glucose 4-epimerase GalE [Ramlibacter sp.]